MAWQLTQVSAGIKICDERAINPLTGQRLFRESGYDKVQSRYVRFPLYVHIAKDNSEFYSNHDTVWTDFKHKLNSRDTLQWTVEQRSSHTTFLDYCRDRPTELSYNFGLLTGPTDRTDLQFRSVARDRPTEQSYHFSPMHETDRPNSHIFSVSTFYKKT